MANNRYSEDEQRAWDLYFAAALPVVSNVALAATQESAVFWKTAVGQAGAVADVMLDERRERRHRPTI